VQRAEAKAHRAQSSVRSSWCASWYN
jgi:hypothetical protein